MIIATAESTLKAWKCECGRVLAFVRLGPPGTIVNHKCGKCGRLNVLST